MRNIVLTCLYIIGSALSGQSTVQFRIDTTIATYVVMEQGVVTPDGSVWAMLNAGSSKVLWKGSAQGTPLWSAVLDSADQYATIAALPNNGCVLVSKLPIVFIPSGGAIDTLQFALTVTVLRPDGTLHWRRKVTSWSLDGDPSNSGFRLIAAQAGVDGDLFVLADIAVGGISLTTPYVFKFDPEGGLIWSRKIGRPYLNSYLRWGYGTWGIVPAPDGGGYLWSGTNPGVNRQQLLRFDDNGDVLWSKQQDNNETSAWTIRNVILDAQGNPNLLGGINNGPLFAVLLKLDQQGELLRGSMYNGLNGWTGFFGGGVRGPNNVFYTSAEEVVLLDPDGEVITAIAMPDTTVDEYSYRFSRGTFNMHGNRVVLAGNVVVNHDVQGFINAYPEVWAFDPDVLDGCMLQRFAPTRSDLPAEEITVIADTTFVSLVAGTTSVPEPFHAVVRDPFNSLATCSIFLHVGIAEHMGLDLRAYSANGMLHISSDIDARVVLYDGQGRMVHQGTVIKGRTEQIPIDQLQSGVYLLRASTPNGGGSTVRVVVW